MTELVTSIAALRSRLDTVRRSGRTVGLVPTLGYLHDGHRSLIVRSVADNDASVVTNFVNPLQFAAGEDFERYPRDLDGDLRLAESAGADWMLAPSVGEMYPSPVATTVSVSGVSAVLEGAHRPGHFDGVATVVTKLFSIAGACRAYFGEKDFQQLSVIRSLTRDLSLPVEVVACPTIREPDGLAMSSRNVYLAAEERAVAPVLYRALCDGARAVEGGVSDPRHVVEIVESVVATEPRVALGYAACVDPDTFEVPAVIDGEVRLLIAARIGTTRLIDNIGARPQSGAGGTLGT